LSLSITVTLAFSKAVSANASFNPESPVLTLYAAWVPNFTCEFYSVNDDGSVTLINTQQINPLEGTEITLPTYDKDSYAYEIDGVLYNLYLNESCTGNKIDGSAISHTGFFNEQTATVVNPVMKIYCKPVN
jgi:hypothetical protein